MKVSIAGLLPVSALFAQVAPAQAVDFATARTWPGVWSYRAVPGGSEALFTDASGGVRISIRCTRPTRVVTLSRTSAAPASTMFVWTTSAQRSLPARFEPNAIRVSADLAANDALLDAIAYSRGRIAVSMPGIQPLVIAPGPEAARVFEDCRN
jgi:hypothetical protein